MATTPDNHLKAELRTQFGKGAARKIRATAKIPAVLYGHGTDPRHLTLPGHELALLLRKANQVLELEFDGGTELALVKDVQKDPVKQLIEHVDLVLVRRGEKVTVDIAVRVEGESAPGTISNLENATLSIEAEATHIPESVTIQIEGAEDGTQVLASQVPLPQGSTLITDPDTVVLVVSTPAGTEADDEAAAASEAAAAESAE